MRRVLPGIALVGLLVVIGAVILLVLGPATDQDAAGRADTLASELRCPDCQGLSVADSPTTSAQEIRRQIDELLAAGATDDEVRAHFVSRYGDWILLAPSNPIVWIAPLALVALAAVALVTWLARRRAAPAPEGVALTPEERVRLHEEAEALDA